MIEKNEYEEVFENWLIENHLQYAPVDQQKRKLFARNKIKSFDFILYPTDSPPVMTEIKGRVFKGKSLENRSGLECWVTLDDVKSLMQWELIFDEEIKTAFVFVYKIMNVDVETDGADIFDFAGSRYFFYTVELDSYREFMKTRSPKWNTVTLPADRFRELAVPAREYFLGE
jgi:hypothetical protein